VKSDVEAGMMLVLKASANLLHIQGLEHEGWR
jgi:hypothetical protein